MRFKTGHIVRTLVFTLAASCILAGGVSIGANANGTAKAKSEGRIRSSASTSSDVVASVTKGMKLDIVASTTDGEGYTWYKILVDGSKYGYIRSDLVSNVEGSIAKEDGSSSNNTSEAAAPATEVVEVTTTVNPTNVTGATVKNDAVKVREGASTKTNQKGTVTKGTEVSISGEATDSEGKLWYQVSYSEGTGFIRSDCLENFVMAEETQPEEVVEEEPEFFEEEPEVVVPQDYEVKYEANSEGIEEWYLYDHIKGTKMPISNINALIDQSRELAESGSTDDDLAVMKIIIAVLAALVVIFVIVITVLAFKFKDSNDDYDDYEDEEDEEDDEEDEPEVRRFGSRRRRVIEEDEEDDEDEDEDEDDEDDEDDYVERRGLFGRRSSRRKSRIDYDDEDEDDEDEEERPVKKPAWPTRGNFDVDDDMEFEFLDLDD